jgi:hypothetical protein
MNLGRSLVSMPATASSPPRSRIRRFPFGRGQTEAEALVAVSVNSAVAGSVMLTSWGRLSLWLPWLCAVPEGACWLSQNW